MIDRLTRGVRNPLTVLGLAALAWSLFWIPLILADVRAATALGQGAPLGELGVHHAFQLLFVAAHMGIRWLAGMLVLGGAHAALVLRRRRAARILADAPGDLALPGGRRPQPVVGD